MTTDRQEQLSHADRHDLDKLVRWKAGLDAPDILSSSKDGAAARFPVCAVFLVSPEDRAAHDIFRRYRSAFEELGGGFHHLVIFGQHGISTTLTAFLAELGMEPGSVPLLAVVPLDIAGDVTGDTTGPPDGAGRVCCLNLPKGERDGELDDSQSWGTALELIRAAVAGTAPRPISLNGVVGAVGGAFRCGSLAAAVDSVLERLGGAE